MSSVAAPVSTAPRRLLPLWLRLVVLSIASVAGYYLLLLLVVEGGSATATQQVFNALTLGSIYALVALGYTMVYGIIELINFAHGDVFMVGAFISLYFLAGPLNQTGAVTDVLLLAGLLLLLVVEGGSATATQQVFKGSAGRAHIPFCQGPAVLPAGLHSHARRPGRGPSETCETRFRCLPAIQIVISQIVQEGSRVRGQFDCFEICFFRFPVKLA